MSVRLEMAPELADLAPALEIIVGVFALFERDDLSEVPEQQGKGTPGPHDANRHIVLVEHKDVAVQTRLTLSCNHGSHITSEILRCLSQ